MIWLVVLLIYILGYYPSARFFTKRTLIRVERDYPILVSSEERYVQEAREAAAIALLPALVWPIAFPINFLWINIVDGISKNVETPRRKAVRQEQELRELRALARKHNLPLPEALDS